MLLTEAQPNPEMLHLINILMHLATYIGSPMREEKKTHLTEKEKVKVSQTFGHTSPWNIRLWAYHSKTTEAWGYLQYKRKGWGLKDGASRTCRKLATVERLPPFRI